jgi:hypothetical protein
MIVLLWGEGFKSKSGPQITQISLIKSGYVGCDGLVGGSGVGCGYLSLGTLSRQDVGDRAIHGRT